MNELKGQLCLDEWLELIKEDKNLNGAYFSIFQYIDLIEKENQQLKIQTSAREEEYKKLEDNWNKLKESLRFIYDFDYGAISDCLDKMQELERGVSDVED